MRANFRALQGRVARRRGFATPSRRIRPNRSCDCLRPRAPISTSPLSARSTRAFPPASRARAWRSETPSRSRLRRLGLMRAECAGSPSTPSTMWPCWPNARRGYAWNAGYAPPFPSSVTPFGHKFGCAPKEAVALLNRARQLGLAPDGVSFHVGSQQLDPTAWDLGIRCAAEIFDEFPGPEDDQCRWRISPSLCRRCADPRGGCRHHHVGVEPLFRLADTTIGAGTGAGDRGVGRHHRERSRVGAHRHRWPALGVSRYRPLRRSCGNRERVHPVSAADTPRRRSRCRRRGRRADVRRG